MSNISDEYKLVEAAEKGKLLQKAIGIVETLANSSIADSDSSEFEENDENDEIEALKRLIMKARTIVNDRWWK